ncbi:DinB family protein [Algoriphagus confluentis]|uniref:DinB-like domain-containing protein n=1 Tax=Algoriphagus confluentis TaxID=1697556 RepID=A0ABQ6PS87_9BACT|nr:hypothetical protein Aconfl_34970 [Algoriphagus confluentis]
MDIPSLKTLLWNQFGASIDMLIQAIDASPDGYFEQNPRFYYIAFHSAIFLDYYLTIPPEDFSPLLSFTQKSPENRPKEAIDDCIPDRIYSKKELLAYLRQSRSKAQTLIHSLTEEKFKLRFTEGEEEGDMDYPLLEILLYNLRHTQHHAAQLNLLIRQDMDLHLKWSFRVEELE